MELTPLAQRTLQIAKRHLGDREATGHNDGAAPGLFQRFIAPWMERQPWCVAFAVYCVHAAAREVGTVSLLPKTGSSSTLYAWAKQNKRTLPKPRPGCIGFVRGGRTGHSHTFLVHDVQGDEVVTVEGNFRNAVGWGRRKIGANDYSEIC